MGNSESIHIVQITTNFNITNELRQKLATIFCQNMKDFEPFIEFYQMGETDIIYKGTTDRVFKIRFKYISGSTPNYGVKFVRKHLLHFIEHDLNVKVDRVVVMCSQLDPDRG